MGLVVFVVVYFVMPICLGYWIGRRKGRPLLGSLLGLLGWLGLIGVAFLPAKDVAPFGDADRPDEPVPEPQA